MRLLILFVLMSSYAFSQEVVSDLMYNTQLEKTEKHSANKRMASALSLPFFDDFSNYKGYPKATHWIDQDAFINTSLAFEPLNIGVATLDGLDSLGNPRNIISSSAHGDADYLTSKQIDVSGHTQVYLSFYFQPEGIGNAPESNDVLELDLKDTAGVWVTVWDTTGFNTSPFQKKVLTIDGAAFLHQDFQFRFHNKATLSGNFDHWHIDNVLLTEDYSLVQDEEDVAFIDDAVRLLEHYYQMPWTHFQTNQSGWMKSDLNTSLRNNYSSTQSVDYRYDVYENQNLIYHYPTTGPTRNDNVFDYASAGNFSYSQNSSSPIALYTYLFADNGEQTASFNIQQSIATDDANHFKNNDTLVVTQSFDNFYALDDASAEASYGVNVSGGKVAIRFNLAKADSLKALRMHFQQNLTDVSASAFQIVVWENDGGVPGDTIRVFSTLFYPEYTNQHNGFDEYVLEEPIHLSGSFFIGWQQFYPDILNIGLDKNTINNDRMYYNIGSSWQQSSCSGCEGTWMMRPVFGSLTATNNVEAHQADFEMYPNPVNGMVTISNSEEFSLKVYSLTGATVYSSNNLSKTLLMNVDALESGIYVVELKTEQSIHRKKLIVQ